MTGVFQVLDGKQAGTNFVARRFPFRIGRAPAVDLRLDESGVWDEHLQIGCSLQQGFTVRVQAPALASLNDKPMTNAVLKNGDVLRVGSIRLSFWLPPAPMASQRTREALTWVGLGGLAGLQVWLIYWMSR